MISLEMKRKSLRWPTVVDLFCGCGGVTEALKQHHFRVVAAVDHDPIACKTFRKNHPSVNLYEKDIHLVDPYQIRHNDLQEQDLDVLVVCAPCQPFSSQNRRRGDDHREHLLLSVIPFVKALSPRLIFFENVPGLARERFASVLSQLKTKLEAIGYFLSDPTPADAADYGVPQRRVRCIMLARKGTPPPSRLMPTIKDSNRTTVSDAFRNLRKLSSGESDKTDPLHFARTHRPIALERLHHIPQNGGSRNSLPKHLQLACHVDHDGHPDVYGRMAWNDVAPTLTTGCTDITKGRFAHPNENRAITLREAARLQTFPDTYHFEGSPVQIAMQIGNAVPVQLMKALVPILRAAIKIE
jgi:DNA (cytosine-5)-methyltransferase 1